MNLYKYVGQCTIFCGINQDEEDIGTDYNWYLEPEEDTKTKLIAGLKSVGVTCESIEFTKSSFEEGIRHCTCICYWNKIYISYDDDFFIKGLSSFAFERNREDKQMEFYFSQQLN